MNSVLGAVSASPSGPPSVTFTWSVSQIARLFSGAMPGSTVSAVVSRKHCEPIVVSGVAAQGIVNENVVSDHGARSRSAGIGGVELVGDAQA